jgi:cytochrome c oxidase subunit 2
MNFPIFPVQASTFAEHLDPMFYLLAAFICVYTIGVTIVLIYFGTKYRQIPGSGRKSKTFHSMKLELLWTGVPLVIAIGIFVWGAILYYDFHNAPPNTSTSASIGKQWMWKLQHPNGRARGKRAHMSPWASPVKLTMTSQDVIHNFLRPRLPCEAGRAARASTARSGLKPPRWASTRSSAPSTAAPSTPPWAARFTSWSRPTMSSG